MLRRLTRVFLILFAAALLALTGAFALAQTEFAKRRIGRAVAAQLSGEHQRAEIEGLAGLLPFEVRVGRFSLRDEKGTWLEIEQAELQLSPGALLAGRLEIENLGAARVELARLPAASPEQEQAGVAWRLPEPASLVPPAVVDRLHLDEIVLGRAVLGTPARFRAEGALASHDPGRKAALHLAITRLDRPGSEARLEGSLDLPAARFALRAQAKVDAELLRAVAGAPDAGPLSFTLTAGGPFEEFAAGLVLDAPKLMSARAEAQVALAEDRKRLLLEATVDLAAERFGPEVAGLVGEKAKLAIDLEGRAGGSLRLHRLEVASAFLRAEGSGAFEPADDRISGRLEARIDDLAPLEALIGIPVAGRLTVVANASGAAGKPQVQARLTGRGLQLQALDLAALDADLVLKPLRPLREGLRGAVARGRIEARNARLEGRDLLGERPLTLALDADLPLEGEIVLRRLALKSEPLIAQLGGSVDPTARRGKLVLTGESPDLAALLRAFAPAAAGSIGGRLRFEAEAKLSGREHPAAGRILLEGRELALPPAARELLGRRPGLRADFALGPETLVLDDLRVEGAAARVVGSLSLDHRRDLLTGRLEGRIGSLEPLAPLVGGRLAGAVEAGLEIAGSLDVPRLTLTVQARDPRYGDYALDRLGLDAVLSAPPGGMQAQFRLTAARADVALALEGKLRQRDEHLEIEAAKLSGPGVSGRLQGEIELARLRGRGELALEVSELSALAAIHRQTLAGAVSLHATAELRDGRQNLRLTGELQKLDTPAGYLERAEVHAQGVDLHGAPKLEVDLDVRDFEAQDLVVRKAEGRLSGGLDALALEFAIDGVRQERFALQGRATADLSGREQVFLLTALEGTLGTRPVRLEKPMKAVLDRGVLTIDRIDLRVGKARVRGDVQWGANRVKLALGLHELPLTALSELGGPAFRGTATASLALDGPEDDLGGSFELHIDDLRPDIPELADTPPATVDIRGRLGEGKLEVRLLARRLPDARTRLEIAVPLRLGLRAPPLELAADGALEGRVEANVELATLAVLAGLDDQILRGELEARLALGGTLEAPELDGAVTIRHGHVEDAVTGIVARDVTVDLIARGERIALARFEARDRRGGRLQGSGELAFTPGVGLASYKAILRATGFEVLNSELGWALADGTLKLAGDARQGRLEGRIRVARAEFRVTDGGIEEPIALEVSERDGRGRLTMPLSMIEPEAGPDRAQTLELDITLEAPARLFLRGRGLDTEWNGRMRIAGSLAAPEFDGGFRFRRGRLDFLGQRFAIQQGEISVLGGASPQIYLDLSARAESDGIVAKVQLVGPIEHPELRLASEPRLAQDEILARLLFGRSASELTPLQGVKLAAALHALQGGDGFNLLASLRDATGLDRLDVGNDEAGAYVSAGKYVSDEVYVEVEQGTSADDTRVRMEVELSPSVSVNSQVSTSGESEVELEWRFDY